MSSSHTPLPLQVAASLKTLTGDDLKVMVVLCFQAFNCDRTALTLEQIEALGNISRHVLKPCLNRLMRRAWVIQDGPMYRLALQLPELETSNSVPVNYDPALGIRPQRVQANLLYPDGPWLTETGFLLEDFVRDRVEVWRKGDHFNARAFGAMATEDVMGIVCKHYAKYENHGNLEIDWHSFCLKNQRYLQNVKQRLDAGVEIQDTEQAQVMAKLPMLQQQSSGVYASEIEPDGLPRASTLTTTEVTKTMAALTQTRSFPTAMLTPVREVRSLSRLDRLNLWIQDPILRREAEREATAAGYGIERSEAGVAFRVVDLENCEDF
ncbi:MAG: hypothetical protein NT070_06585 [Cyanobacteria bacterium]|nr:hypothetical protein [Cyanobacteriota bacterium]